MTGCCECVGYVGPALGGGHGWLQGRHGLIADQFESMNIVLSNGTLATIDSKSELWWALKGAGHNFGIVTSVTSKIYDIEHKNWAFEIMTFKGDKVEELYKLTNEHILKNGTQPTDVINWSYWFNIPDVDPTGVSTRNRFHASCLTRLLRASYQCLTKHNSLLYRSYSCKRVSSPLTPSTLLPSIN